MSFHIPYQLLLGGIMIIL